MMIKILLSLALLTTTLLVGQDTTFYEISGREALSLSDCHHYVVTIRNDIDTNEVTQRGFYKSGKQKSLSQYNDNDKRIYDGNETSWYENGQINWVKPHKNGKYDGELISFWENGQMKRKDVFENDSLLIGVCWNNEGLEVEYYDFETMPEFPGGEAGLYTWLGQNIVYPQRAKEEGITGVVFVNFAIDATGKVEDIKIIRGIGGGCDEEVLRLINLSPDWTPGKLDGNNVRVSFNLPVRFTLINHIFKKKKKKQKVK